MPSVDDALQFLIEFLKNPENERRRGHYGYDVYIPRICEEYARTIEGVPNQDPHAAEQRIAPLSTVFYEAAWVLCRRGILRPGVKAHRMQVTDDGSGGNGYSFTSVGLTWLQSDEEFFIPTEPARVARLLADFRDQFGDGFYQRAQEAIRCYSAQAYLASCAMCGAAAESILLSLAIEKVGDEDNVMREYRAASGRRRVTQRVLQGAPQRVGDSFRELTALLNYWRDDASHGVASEISEFESYEAIARLLRFAHFASDHYDELTA